jgi:hypothetical protein
MSKSHSTRELRFEVKNVFGSGVERCVLRWPIGAHFDLDSYYGDWRQVRDVDFWIDRSAHEAVLLFTRNCRGRGPEPRLVGKGSEDQNCAEEEESEQKYN